MKSEPSHGRHLETKDRSIRRANPLERQTAAAKEALKVLLYWIYRLAPKQRQAVVYGWPDFEDSAMALQAALGETDVHRVVFLVSDDRTLPLPTLGARTSLARKNSLRGLVGFLTARYVFFTHPCYLRRFPPGVTSVNVWHGMPVKRIGNLQPNNPQGISSHYVLATSSLWAPIMQASMGPLVGPLVTGLPRNDRMLDSARGVGPRLQLGSFRKLVLWLPTHRQAAGDEGHMHEAPSDPLGIGRAALDVVNALLDEHGALALAKLHPLARVPEVRHLSNIRLIDDVWLRSKGLTLYQLLGQADLLVTDVSSVYVDYLLVDRPVIHLFPDFDEYAKSRGFSLAPIDDYLVGPLVKDDCEFIDCLRRLLRGEDTFRERRRLVCRLFHEHHDDQATRRLLRALGLE